MSIELKIKFLTLGYEAKQIQRFERKLLRMRNRRVEAFRSVGAKTYSVMQDVIGDNPLGYYKWGNAKLLSLQHHRREVVRPVARHTHLARMFLKRTPYKAAERDARTQPNWNFIQKMAEKYARYAKIDADPERGEFRSVQDLAQQFEHWKQGS